MIIGVDIMKKFMAYKHNESGCIWVPFYEVVDNKKIEMVTNGIIIRELTEERKTKISIVEITEEEFRKAISNLSIDNFDTWKINGIHERFGLLFTVIDVNRLSKEYMKENNLFCDLRITEDSPLYQYGELKQGIHS